MTILNIFEHIWLFSSSFSPIPTSSVQCVSNIFEYLEYFWLYWVSLTIFLFPLSNFQLIGWVSFQYLLISLNSFDYFEYFSTCLTIFLFFLSNFHLIGSECFQYIWISGILLTILNIFDYFPLPTFQFPPHWLSRWARCKLVVHSWERPRQSSDDDDDECNGLWSWLYFEVEVQQDFETGACSAFCRWCFVEIMKLNLGRYSETRLGQDFEF